MSASTPSSVPQAIGSGSEATLYDNGMPILPVFYIMLLVHLDHLDDTPQLWAEITKQLADMGFVTLATGTFSHAIVEAPCERDLSCEDFVVDAKDEIYIQRAKIDKSAGDNAGIRKPEAPSQYMSV